jgi:hypothetical protein
MQLLLLVLFPFAANFVCFLSKGMVYYLMVYAFLLLYVFAWIVVRDNLSLKEKVPDKAFKWQYLLLVPMLWLSLNNIVFSNQIYLKLHMSVEAAHSIMTRIVSDIEKTEGYLWGQTPVAFIGGLENSRYLPQDDYLSELNTSPLPFSNKAAFYPYLAYHLGANVNVYELPLGSTMGADMPCFPEEGYIKFQDGILAVKLSD